MAGVLKISFALLFVIFMSNWFNPIYSAVLVKRESQNENQTQTEVTSLSQTEDTATAKPKKICELHQGCGWGVYKPFTRDIQYFMKNSCECPDNQNCIRVDDDSTISAYVYKCRFKRGAVTLPATP